MVAERDENVNNSVPPEEHADCTTPPEEAPRRRLGMGAERPAEDSLAGAAGPPYGLFRGDEEDRPDDPQEWGIYRYQYRSGENGVASLPRQITNFHIIIDRDLQIEDEQENTRRLEGRLVLRGRQYAFNIDAKDFFDNGKILSAIGAAAGAEARTMCKPQELRDAISWLNYHGGRWQAPVRQRRTTRFGWNTAGDAYLFPGGKITADGFIVATDDDELRVQLGGEQWACNLDLLDPDGSPSIADLQRQSTAGSEFCEIHGGKGGSLSQCQVESSGMLARGFLNLEKEQL